MVTAGMVATVRGIARGAATMAMVRVAAKWQRVATVIAIIDGNGDVVIIKDGGQRWQLWFDVRGGDGNNN